MERMIGGLKAPVARVGGKRLLKKRIIAEFPSDYEEMTYVEPFIGGGSVFYAKKPSEKEVINDLDKAIYNIHKGLQQYGEKVGKDLQGHYTPDDFYRYVKKKPKTPLGKLSLFLLLSRISFMGQGKTPINKEGRTVKADFAPYQERLKDTTITNKDYKTVMRRYDSPTTLFYLDPPYEGSSEQHYDHHAFDLEELHDFLKTIEGKWIVSMNDSANVRKIFKDYPIKTVTTTYRLPVPHKVKEVIIKNF
jgi:DNA adenine methylase